MKIFVIWYLLSSFYVCTWRFTRETSTLKTGKYTNIQYSINPKPNPKTAFFKEKVDHDPDPTFYWHASWLFRNLSIGRLRFEWEQ